MRELGTVRSYSELIQILRRRCDQLDVSFATIDSVGGLCENYSSKVLARHPCRLLGRVSFSAVLGALGVVLIAVEDPEQLARVKSRLVKRKKNGRHLEPAGG